MSKKVSMKKFNSTVRDIEKNVATLHQGSIKVANASAKAVYTKCRQSDMKLLDGVVGAIVDIAEIEGIKKKKVKKIIKRNFTSAANSVSKTTKKAVNKRLNQAAEIASLSNKQIKSLNIRKPVSKIEKAIDKSIAKMTDMNFSDDDSKIHKKKADTKKKKSEKKAEQQAKETSDFIIKGMKKISDEAKKNGGYINQDNVIDVVSFNPSKKKKKKKSSAYSTDILEGMEFVKE